jgi:ABC-type polysaccharide/polyol phosphate transport system ATPase subunit
LCDSAILLHKGSVVECGDPAQVTDAYEGMNV